MLKNFISLFNNNIDPYVLRVEDRNIALEIWDYPPTSFANSFIEKWASNRNIEKMGTNAQIAKSILEHHDNRFFWKNCKEQRLLDKLNEDELLLEFRDRMRGFQDKHLEYEIDKYKSKIQKNIEEVNPIVEAIRTLLIEVPEHKNRGKALYLNRALSEFTETLENYRQELDEASLVSRAAKKLKYETGLFKGLSKIIGFFQDWDISRPYLKLSTLDLSLDNPFRHMIWAPVPLYYSIQECWERTQSRELCVNIVNEYFDVFNIFTQIVEDGFVDKRKNVLMESLNCARSGYYTASASLLYSQTEGLIFDLATKVNSKSFGDIKIEIFRNPIDLKRYIRSNGKEKDLRSIIDLLFDSDLVRFFWPGFLEYFSSDFYSDRCALAHGEVTTPLSKSDFNTIILFVITVLNTYKEFVDDGRAPILSDCYHEQKK